MMRVLAVIAIVLIAIFGAGLWALWNGSLGSHLGPGELTEVPIPKQTLEARRSFQRAAAAFVGATEPKQILFGDLHVHTAFSLDAFVSSLPAEQSEGPHPPADACDFARYYSALDFWSINDHALGITPQHWQETIDSIPALQRGVRRSRRSRRGGVSSAGNGRRSASHRRTTTGTGP